jgi:hypothetical protein
VLQLHRDATRAQGPPDSSSAMPSHLTRVVFRSIIANTPLACRGCAQRTPRLRPSFHHGTRALAPQRRTFFGIFKAPRKIKPPEVPAGSEVFGDLIRAQNDGVRPPPPAQVAEAWTAFSRQRKPDMEDFHVGKALCAFRYLLENPKADGQPWIPYDNMRTVMKKLVKNKPATGGNPHIALAKLLDAEIEKVIGEVLVAEKDLETLTVYEAVELPKLVHVLSIYGATHEARDLAVKSYGAPSGERTAREVKLVRNVWKLLVAGFAKEGNTPELIKTTEMMGDAAAASEVKGVLVKYFAERNDLEQAKHWYSMAVPEWDDNRGLSDALGPFLTACALSGDTAFGHQVVASLLQTTPNKETWDAIFVWSAAIGKGVDEIDRMMNVMVRRSKEELPKEELPKEEQQKRRKPAAAYAMQPDIHTINSLVELSMAKQDPYSAERFVVLGEKRGIHPDGKTFTMQMRYRLSVNDIDGARAAYYGLQGHISEDPDCADVVNKLIQALCTMQEHLFDDVMAIVDDLHERKVQLAPETIATVCVLHLRRGEPHDAGDLLNMHAHHFSPAQRVVIRNGLASFIMDGKTSTADAWETYQMLRLAFPETPRSDRIPLMKEFFARKRSDMACHVFFHMRNSIDEAVAADKEVYVTAFTGFARSADVESFELASNQLKIDLNVEMDTQLRNALMLAYAATGDNGRALSMWAEIGSSKEGPSYNSIAIAFRACETTHYGERHARSIWQRLKKMDVDIDKQIFTAYMCAIARTHRHDDALALIEAAEEEYGFTPDFYM